MPTLSQYWFYERFFGGPFDVYNLPFSDGSWAWISSEGGTAATLMWIRPDSERAISIATQFNTPDVLSLIDAFISGGASRTSGIRAMGVFWPSVPYRAENPGRHSDWELLIRIYFNFHISTPWLCSDADGNISYYVFAYLDGEQHLRAYVDGWSYEYDGGAPFCTGTINDRLNAQVPAGVATVQRLLDDRLALLSRLTFSALYYLPGSGTRSPGQTSENADLDVAVAVIP